MSSIEEYRQIAENCLRQASEDEHDRTLWITMAQSWLRLAEHAQRLHGDSALGEMLDDEEPVPTDEELAVN